MAGEEWDDDLSLFVRPDGRPMAFMMRSGGHHRQVVRELIESRMGLLLSNPHMDYRDNIIKLMRQGEILLKKDEDVFDYNYVVTCVEQRRILPNLIDYRLNSAANSPFVEYDPLHVLIGIKKWADIPRREEGERVEAIDEYDPDFRDVNDHNYRAFKSVRMPYTRKDQQEIVNFLVKRKGYDIVHGNVIWQRMEENKICGGHRTWQSMKEHFRKQIIPRIATFSLTHKQVARFKQRFGLLPVEMMEFSSSDEERSDEGEESGADELTSTTSRSPAVSAAPAAASSASAPAPSAVASTDGVAAASIVDASSAAAAAPDRIGSSINNAGSVGLQGEAAAANADADRTGGGTSETVAGLASLGREEEAPTERRRIMDVGEDPELEQLLEVSRISRSLCAKFTNSDSDDTLSRLEEGGGKRKRRLFSNESSYLADSPGSQDMFLPPNRPNNNNNKRHRTVEPILEETLEEPASPQDFAAGLREVGTPDTDAESDAAVDGGAGGVTSTQNLLLEDEGSAPLGESSYPEELQLVVQAALQAATDVENIEPRTNLLDQIFGSNLSPSSSADQLLNRRVDTAAEPDGRQPQGGEVSAADSVDPAHVDEADDGEGGVNHAGGCVGVLDLPLVSESEDDQRGDGAAEGDEVAAGAVVAATPSPNLTGKEEEEEEEDLPGLLIDNVGGADGVDVGEDAGGGEDRVPTSDDEERARDSEAADSPGVELHNSTLKRKVTLLARAKRGAGVSTHRPASRAEEPRPREHVLVVPGLPPDIANSDVEILRPRNVMLADLRRGTVTSGSGRSRDHQPSNNIRIVSENSRKQLLRELELRSPKAMCCKHINTVSGGLRRASRVSGSRDSSSQSSSSQDETETSREEEEEGSQSDSSPRPGGSRQMASTPSASASRNEQPASGSKQAADKARRHRSAKKASRAKLKIIALSNLDRTFTDNKFRQPYRKAEDRKILDYLRRHGGYSMIKGVLVWKNMERRGALVGRSWQSLKNRFLKAIQNNLELYGSSEQELREADKRRQNNGDFTDTDDSDEEEEEEAASDTPREEGEEGLNTEDEAMAERKKKKRKRKTNLYYVDEDIKLLRFICEKKRYRDTGGVSLWQTMEANNVVPNRTWASLKERFRKVLSKNLGSPIYGLSKEELDSFRAAIANKDKKKEKRLKT